MENFSPNMYLVSNGLAPMNTSGGNMSGTPNSMPGNFITASMVQGTPPYDMNYSKAGDSPGAILFAGHPMLYGNITGGSPMHHDGAGNQG